MTVDELKEACNKSLANAPEKFAAVTLVSKSKRSPFFGIGFPRPELLCVNAKGEHVWSYPAKKLLFAIERAGRTAPKNVDCPCWATGTFKRVDGCKYHPWDL